MSEQLQVLVLGAGGLGCYYGVRLLKLQHHVTFIARGEHLKALQNNGLILKHPECNYSGEVSAYSFPELQKKYKPEDFDFILLTTKATSTQAIAIELSDWFQSTSQSTAIISLQNGIDNEDVLADYLTEECVIGGLAVRIGGHIISPGKVEAKGVAEIVMGLWHNEKSSLSSKYKPHLSRWSALMDDAGIPTKVVSNIRYELWRKLAINNSVNPLSVLTGLDTKRLSNDSFLGPIVYQLMVETALAARSQDIELTKKDVDEMFELICNFEPIKTSMLVDWEKGRALEIEAIPGAVIKCAELIKEDVPYTKTVYALLQQKINLRESDIVQ